MEKLSCNTAIHLNFVRIGVITGEKTFIEDAIKQRKLSRTC